MANVSDAPATKTWRIIQHARYGSGMTSFDVCIDLTVHIVPAGISPAVAVARVREAVERVPGAGWISVEWCGDAPASAPWLRLFRQGNG